MTHYFAYGSNMSPRQMADRCPGAEPLGIARLGGWRLAFDRASARWGGHVADIVEQPEAEVWGVLWNVDEAHLAALDRFEGVASGAYRRVTVRVEHDGAVAQAITYTVCAPASEGDPSAAYCAVMGEGVATFSVPGRGADGRAAP